MPEVPFVHYASVLNCTNIFFLFTFICSNSQNKHSDEKIEIKNCQSDKETWRDLPRLVMH